MTERRLEEDPEVVRHGIGYDLIAQVRGRSIVLGIRCHVCRRISFHPSDIAERYCGACHVFHEAGIEGRKS